MIVSNRHLNIGEHAVISHFVFKPPLVATANLEQEACFIFPIHARGNIYRPDGKKSVATGQGVLMKCGQYINKWQSDSGMENVEVIIIRFTPDILEAVLSLEIKPSLQQAEPTTVSSSVVIEMDVLLKKYLDSLLFYFEYPQLVNDELVLLKVKELALLLVQSGQQNPISELMLHLFDPLKYDLQQIVDANLTEHLTLTELAALANMSLSTFKRHFKKRVGESPGQYIKTRRLQLAAKQIQQSTSTITEICFDCGFSDPSYFTKAFKLQFGCTPNQFRLKS